MILVRSEGEPLTLSEVHNPKKNSAEIKRIEAIGGRLYHERVGHPKLNPAYVNIAVSRAMYVCRYFKKFLKLNAQRRCIFQEQGIY